MKQKYKINSIVFNEKGDTLNEVVNRFLISFLDKELKNNENNGIINTDIISNL